MPSTTLTQDQWTQIYIGGSSLVDQQFQVTGGKALISLGTPSDATTAIDSAAFDDKVIYVPAATSVFARPNGVTGATITWGNFGSGQTAAGYELFRAGFKASNIDMSPSTIFNLKPSNTQKLRSAMARTDRNAIIACIGPSTTGGQSTGAGTAQAVQSWPMRVAAILQAQGINAGANNAFPDKGSWGGAQTATNYLAGDARMVFSGGTKLSATKTVGGNAITMAAADGASSLTFAPQSAVTKFEIWWRDNGTGRTFSWAIDGGAATNVSSTGAATPQRTIVSAGTSGIHALTIARVAGDVTIMGINAYDDTAGRREISFLNWGISGVQSSRFLDATDGPGGQIAVWNAQAPDAAILDDWPINDWRGGRAISAFKADLITGIQRQKLYGDAFVTTPLWDASTSGNAAQQDAYAAACYEAAMEQDVPLIDVRAAWVSYAAANSLGWYSDTVHPAALGYMVKANAIAEFIRRVRAM